MFGRGIGRCACLPLKDVVSSRLDVLRWLTRMMDRADRTSMVRWPVCCPRCRSPVHAPSSGHGAFRPKWPNSVFLLYHRWPSPSFRRASVRYCWRCSRRRVPFTETAAGPEPQGRCSRRNRGRPSVPPRDCRASAARTPRHDGTFANEDSVPEMAATSS